MQSSPWQIRFVDSIHVSDGNAGADPLLTHVRGRCGTSLATQSHRADGGGLHRIHRVHAGDAVSPDLHQPDGRHRCRRDRGMDGGDPGRDPGDDRGLCPALGPAGGPVRPTAHGRAVAVQFHHHHGGDGVCHRAVALVRLARAAGVLCGLRRALPGDGGRVGAAGQAGAVHWPGADSATPWAGAGPGDRRRWWPAWSVCEPPSS